MTLQALFSGVSGLQSHSTWLDVIGNNLANLNTTAFKASRATFADQLSRNLSAAAGNNGFRGGTNPIQVGMGSRISSIQSLFTQGASLTTGNNLDISIQGEGFLLAKLGSETVLTRAGNLKLDSLGFLVDANGAMIQGFNANLRHNLRPLNSISAVPGQPLSVTEAELVLDASNLSSLTSLRIPPALTLPPKATTEVRFRGNLDSFVQVTQPGGIFDLAPGGQPLLPIAINLFVFPPGIAIDTTRLTHQFLPGGGLAFQQVSNMSATVAYPVVNGGIPLSFVQAVAGGYAWEVNPPVPPAHALRTTVYDSLGAPRELTVQFYQVNDLGAAGMNGPGGPSQAVYTWYAFETTGGQAPTTANLLGGTGIIEGEQPFVTPQWWYDRNQTGDLFIGDFIWFNSDGSLAGSGGSGGPVPTPPGVPNFMSIPRVYLPPNNTFPPVSPFPNVGAEIMAIDLNFGTFGILTNGRRDGLFSDAAGAYQTVNGINQYVPNHSAYVDSQNGYPDGVLQDISFDQGGTLNGTFSNGKIVALARLSLAQVDNPQGLNREGNTYYSQSANSGALRIGLAGTGGMGEVQGYSLEGSNVDISVELSGMILAQRGMQANAQIITKELENQATTNRLGQ